MPKLSVNGHTSHTFRPKLVVAGSSIRFSGEGVLEGVAAKVPETTYTLTASAKKRTVTGYLVLKKAENEVQLAVDEVEWGPEEERFDFRVESNFQLLERIFWFDVPAGVATFDSIDVSYKDIIVVVVEHKLPHAEKLKVGDVVPPVSQPPGPVVSDYSTAVLKQLNKWLPNVFPLPKN